MLTDETNLARNKAPIEETKEYIKGHIDQRLDRRALAEKAGFSLPHFQRRFRALTGEGVAAYIHRLRMERAGRKLRMGAVDITEVALAAGYDSHAAFSKAFKRYFKISPSQFRLLGCRAATRLLHKGRT
jgi:AraC family transcriptional regulator